MPVDHIRYDVLVQQALRGMVRDVLVDIARAKVLPGEHHFFITFDTGAEGVRLSDRLRAQYPDEMTVVLQHQFRDLQVTDDGFQVGLSFGGVSERLTVPFAAIKALSDPSVQFTLQFETLGEPANDGEAPAPRVQNSGRTSDNRAGGPPTLSVAPMPNATDGDDKDGKPSGDAQVVRLDRFRKK